jgi:hypothetical protein
MSRAGKSIRAKRRIDYLAQAAFSACASHVILL